MKDKKIYLLIIVLVILAAAVREDLIKRPGSLHHLNDGRIDMCLSCHRDQDPGPAHGPRSIGCAVCHRGDPLAIDKKKAHKGMFINPGDLRAVPKTCGTEGCHAKDRHLVENSLMATNRGIISTLLYYWGEAGNQYENISVKQLIDSGRTSLALDYYRKLCATCHLWKQKNDLPDASEFFNEKGGGCSACHVVKQKERKHPLLTKKVPIKNCVRCHNRSGRVGTSYQGIYESEGYGTPYENGGLSKKRLPGDRFYQSLAPDIHYKKGMACIDCHTREEIMGDGNRYAHYEEQLEIDCRSCHGPNPGTTHKGRTLNNVSVVNGSYVLKGKIDGRIRPLLPPKAGVCDSKVHARVGCEACHASWVPQCYGCHVKRDAGDTHLDKLSLKETPGWWEEGRSYLRYEKPALALWAGNVVIVTPGCQDIVTLVNEKGEPGSQFTSLTVAALSPHTTQAKGRSCAGCHTSPKTLGLGRGTVQRNPDGSFSFTPIDQGLLTADGITPPLDGFVNIDGTPLQKTSRPDLRPFNGEELRRILRVGLCLGCHKDRMDDRAFKKYRPDTACPPFKKRWPVQKGWSRPQTKSRK